MLRPKRAVVIGLDAPIASRVYNYAKKGLLPNIGRLMREGVYAVNYLVTYPTVTPQSWTTIATGANVGTHGITGFRIYLPGRDLNELTSAFNTSLCQAEYLWEAVERGGGKVIIINWPCSWPPTIRSGYQLGGGGLSMNEWRTGRLLYEAKLCDGQLFTTLDLPYATKVELKPAKGWMNMPSAKRVLEAELKPKYTACVRAGDSGVEACIVKGPTPWWMLVLDTNGNGFSEVILAWKKDVKSSFVKLRPGKWSPIIIGEFDTDEGKKQGAFRCKLIELSSDASRLRLFITPICSLEGYAYPAELLEEVIKVNPLAMPSHIIYDGFGWGWYGLDTFFELMRMEHEWFADVATYLMKTKEWNLLMMHMHAPDWLYHYAIPPEFMDPSSPKYVGPRKAEALEEIELGAYRIIDEAIGKIVDVAGDDALIVIVSDHGIKPKLYRLDIAKPLADAGLLVLKPNGEIDFRRSKVIPGREGPWIYVNLQGRFRHGIVDPSEYEEVREEVIKVLYDYVDPKTGVKPIALVLKKEDARLLGLYGPRVGDIIYASRPEYGSHHGQLPTAELGIGSLRGLLIMKGPGVKRGCVLKRTIRGTDIVPTICYLLDFPVPRNAEGGIIYQALEGFPDEERRERYKEALEEIRKHEKESEESFQVIS